MTPNLHEWVNLFLVIAFVWICINLGRWLERDDMRIKNEAHLRESKKTNTRT